jgi:hypothetical protein
MEIRPEKIEESSVLRGIGARKELDFKEFVEAFAEVGGAEASRLRAALLQRLGPELGQKAIPLIGGTFLLNQSGKREAEMELAAERGNQAVKSG